jgi:hypothetical protein
LLAQAAGTETNGFSDATTPAFHAELDGAGDIAIAAAEETQEPEEVISVLAGIEATDARVSAPAGLALLEATCQLTEQSPPPVKQADDPTPGAARDPFEQARKSLSKSSFGIRVVHNDGDPSDRNLI